MDNSRIEDQGKRQSFRVRWYWILLAALSVAGIVTSVVVLRSEILDFRHYGYLGVFLISLLASATVVALIPSVPVIFALGGILNPFFVGLVAGIGEAMGALTGYFAGRTGHAFFIRDRSAGTGRLGRFYSRLQKWVETRGSLALFLSSAIFNPFFVVIGATAGALRFPAWKFFLTVWAGKTVKWTLVSLVGWGAISYILHRFGITL